MKKIMSLIMIITSLAWAQATPEQTLTTLRLKAAEMSRFHALSRLSAITNVYKDDKEMTQAFDVVSGAMISSASLTALVSFFGQTAHGAIKGNMGNEHTHLRRVGLSSLGFGLVVGGVSGLAANYHLRSSEAYREQIYRLKDMTREQAIEEYKQIISHLNSSSEEIEKIKNPRP